MNQSPTPAIPTEEINTAATWSQLESALPKLQPALDAYHRNTRLYRGVSQSDHLRYNHQMTFGQRRSKNTDNYYTLIIDHDHGWATFPPRSSSVIASTEIATAGGYGTTYVLLPEGDPTIGVCSDNDLWNSFGELRHLDQYMDLSDLNRVLKTAFSQLLDINRFDPVDHNDLVHKLSLLDQWIEDNPQLVDQLQTGWRGQLKPIYEMIKIMPHMPMLARLRDLLDPWANGFWSDPLSDLNLPSTDKEVWFTAPTWMIRRNVIPQAVVDNQVDLADWIKSQASLQQPGGISEATRGDFAAARQARSAIRHSEDPADPRVTAILKEKGWRILGTGVEAMVATHPNRPYVLKVFPTSSAYVHFVDYCRKNPNNPYLPKFSRYVRPIPGTVFSYVRMEQLSHFSKKGLVDLNPELWCTLYHMFAIRRDNISWNAGHHIPQLEDLPQRHGYRNVAQCAAAAPALWTSTIQGLLDVMTSHGLDTFDLHSDNVMLRGSQLVITDPFV
jgi:hypothetical protein